MNKKEKRHNATQALAREHLAKLQYRAEKYGLGQWLKDIIKANKRKECEATQSEVMLLARCVDEERIARKDIPKLFGMSYRQAEEKDLFSHITKLGATGTYSLASAHIESKVYNG